MLTSDSGCLSILEYDTVSHSFSTVFNYKFGETGCLFKTPGQYLRVNPGNNRIVVGMCCSRPSRVGGLNGDVLVFPVKYALNDDHTSIRFQEAAPLGYHKEDCIVYDLVWMDENSFYTLSGSTAEQRKVIDAYEVGSDAISCKPGFITLEKDRCYTRLIPCACCRSC